MALTAAGFLMVVPLGGQVPEEDLVHTLEDWYDPAATDPVGGDIEAPDLSILADTLPGTGPESVGFPGKLDLNRADTAALEALDRLTPYQISELLAHRERYGPFFSVYELNRIPGFRHLSPGELEELFQAGPDPRRPGRPPPGNALQFGWGRRFPRADGYAGEGTSSSYAGSPARFHLRYRQNLGPRTTVGAILEKDAGETVALHGRPGCRGLCPIPGRRTLRGDLILGQAHLNLGLSLLRGSPSCPPAGIESLSGKHDGPSPLPFPERRPGPARVACASRVGIRVLAWGSATVRM
ncbi:MAG: helix-hairpin-helix domain-containing protein [Bacteroidales bacterium]